MTFQVGDWVVTQEEVEVPLNESPGYVSTMGPGFLGPITHEAAGSFRVRRYYWHKKWLKPVSFSTLGSVPLLELEEALSSEIASEKFLALQASIQETLLMRKNNDI